MWASMIVAPCSWRATLAPMSERARDGEGGAGASKTISAEAKALHGSPNRLLSGADTARARRAYRARASTHGQ